MTIYIIADTEKINLLDINSIMKKYPNNEFTLSSDLPETSTKNDLLIFMKDFKSYNNIKGNKSLFLNQKVNLGNEHFIITSFNSDEINIHKIKLLLNIFLT